VLARRQILLLLSVTLLASCGGGGGGEQTATATFRNPVHAEDFPDPFLLEVDGTWYAYGTNGDGGNVQTLTSPDLITWTKSADALPALGSWAFPGKTWAPEVLALDGRYVLYYTANAAEAGVQCIGRAVAASPAGPFEDTTGKPLVCQRTQGGSIDASPFREEDGSLYLLWKNDGNSVGEDTWIHAQRLSRDGLELTGHASRLVKQDAGWEADVVEAPTLWLEAGRYYLFFSGNGFYGDLYAVGYATCEDPLGPCTDAPENPILRSACDASGPGHQTIVRDDDGETWLLYHAWPASGGEEERELWLDRLVWEEGKPVVKGPTCRPQTAP
jgi:beta-xylosidase